MRKIIFRLLRYSGFPFLFREIIQKNRVTMVVFHDISREAAEKIFTYLADKFKIIDLNDFLDAIEKKDKSRIPPKALIMTFDDGHIRNFELLPIIKKLNIPITFFLCAAIIDSKRHFWFKLKKIKPSKFELKHKPNAERLEILSKAGFKQDEEFDHPEALQKPHIDAMKQYVSIQAHTLFHPCLPQCDDVEAKKEIFLSKELIEREYGVRVTAMAYPNGDYSERDVALVKEAGYKCGVTVDPGYNTFQSDVFRLKRFSVNDSDDINEVIVKVSGLWALLTKRSRLQKCVSSDNSIKI